MTIYLSLLILSVALAITAILFLDAIVLNARKHELVRIVKLRDKLHFAMVQSRGAT